MFSPQQKREISMKVQAILQATEHDELPDGEINFILHVDGEDYMSWANIRNNPLSDVPVPSVLMRNLTKS